MTAPLDAIALVDADGQLSLSHVMKVESRAEWEAELQALTEKLAQKGATHSLRLIDVRITPVSPKPKQEALFGEASA
jgi:hypothetical protein